MTKGLPTPLLKPRLALPFGGGVHQHLTCIRSKFTHFTLRSDDDAPQRSLAKGRAVRRAFEIFRTKIKAKVGDSEASGMQSSIIESVSCACGLCGITAVQPIDLRTKGKLEGCSGSRKPLVTKTAYSPNSPEVIRLADSPQPS